MKYFIDEQTRKDSHSTCYFEFMKGSYQGKCWLSDSISISDDLFDELKIYEVISSVIPSFDYYGVNEISKGDWEKIVDTARSFSNKTQESIEEANTWAINVFSGVSVITICGI